MAKAEQNYAIKERMEQISELQQNLKQTPEEYVEKKNLLETPKHIFDVSPDEIKVEKYLT
jgi:cell shape-determining protein MreC